MLHYALVFFVIALIAAVLAFIFAIVGVPFFIWCARREATGLD